MWFITTVPLIFEYKGKRCRTLVSGENHTLSLKICFLATLAAAISIAVSSRQDGDCKAPAGTIYDCSQYIYSNCKNATYIAQRLAFNQSYSSVSLFWNAPQYNMTILFESGFLKPHQLCINPVGCAKTFRTLDSGQETDVEWNTFIEYSYRF